MRIDFSNQNNGKHIMSMMIASELLTIHVPY